MGSLHEISSGKSGNQKPKLTIVAIMSSLSSIFIFMSWIGLVFVGNFEKNLLADCFYNESDIDAYVKIVNLAMAFVFLACLLPMLLIKKYGFLSGAGIIMLFFPTLFGVFVAIEFYRYHISVHEAEFWVGCPGAEQFIKGSFDYFLFYFPFFCSLVYLFFFIKIVIGYIRR